MATGGSSGRPGSGSRSFDFGSDDVLCSYDDYSQSPQDQIGGKRPGSSARDANESRTGRQLVDVYGQEEEYSKDVLISSVERCMKKYADNLLRVLEGISGRLKDLELYYYKLERTIGELRSDMVRDQTEKDHQLKSLEKHLQEVHRSVQILRDKQELAETQKELAKLQVVPKGPANPSYSQKTSDSVSAPVLEQKKRDETPDPDQKLALVPHQAPSQPPGIISEQNQLYKELPMQHAQPASLNMPQDAYLNRAATFYPQSQPLPPNQQSQLQPEVQYMPPRPQIPQDQAPTQQQQQFPQYQQQWSQQFPQQAVQPQQVSSQAQFRSPAPSTYPPYPQHQPANPVADVYPGSVAMPVPYSTAAQPGGSRPEPVSFNYGGPGSTIPQQQQPHNIQRPPHPQGSQSSSGPPVNKGGYSGGAPYPPQTNVPGYNSMYNSGGTHPQNFQPGSYPPNNASALQNQQLGSSSNRSGSHHPPGTQLMRNHPYGEIIEKATSMGYPRDLVVNVINMMGESGQPIDFNALLDRLNARAAGAPPRGW